jgi:hypothetical protein
MQGNSAEKNCDDMSVTLGDKRPSNSTAKNWVASFRTGYMSTESEEFPGRPSPGNVDAIQSMILDDIKNIR